MPSINLGPRTRFVLYLLGSLASLGVVYAVDKSWAGDAETRLVQGIVALLGILAAANTNTSDPVDQAREVGEAVGAELNRAASLGARDRTVAQAVDEAIENGWDTETDPHRP